ncbi:MAG: hypothetical protein ABJC36_08750 [Gemmatimonadales bacterium]
MLPPGLVAHLAERADHHHLSRLHPAARTVVELMVGACACDLVRARHPDPREDERHHRIRSRRAGGARAALIAGLDRHRRGAQVPPPAEGWPRALAAFVAEHARNAGDTLYLLRFDLPAGADPAAQAPRRLRAADVVAHPDAWLVEHGPVVVGR